ncbi:MAG: hypothetical protein ABL915_09035, partial [Gallionella sp.]
LFCCGVSLNMDFLNYISVVKLAITTTGRIMSIPKNNVNTRINNIFLSPLKNKCSHAITACAYIYFHP